MELLRELAERLANRYYGKYRGVVTDVDAKTMRIKAQVPAVLGAAASGWCQPCVPYAGAKAGFFMLPEAGAGVWIEFEGGDPSYPIWAGCYWHIDEVPPDAAPHVRGIVTPAPHKLLLDDDEPAVTLSDASDGSVTLDSSGVTLARGPQHLTVSDRSISLDDGALEVR